jgi:hypothetical protein
MGFQPVLSGCGIGSKKRLLVRVGVTIIDPYEREHKLLPFGFVHMRDAGKKQPGWYYEPSADDPRIQQGTEAQ